MFSEATGIIPSTDSGMYQAERCSPAISTTVR
jgi:hypothetical protein